MASVELTPNLYYGIFPGIIEPAFHVDHYVDLTERLEKDKLPPLPDLHAYQTYKNFPIKDQTSPNLQCLKEIVDYIDQLKGVVYVFCKGGHGRSGLVAAAVYGKRHHLNGEDALKYVYGQWHAQRDLARLRKKVLKLGSPQTVMQKYMVKLFLDHSGLPGSIGPVIDVNTKPGSSFVEISPGPRIPTILFYTDKKTNKGLNSDTRYTSFSNFAIMPEELYVPDDPDDITVWPTSEHYFQSMKFTGPDVGPTQVVKEYRQFMATTTPYEVFLLGRIGKRNKDKNWTKIGKGTGGQAFKTDAKEAMRQRINTEFLGKIHIRPDWEKGYKIRSMVKAILLKVYHFPKFRNLLKDIPVDTYIVEHTTNDTVWADGGDGGTGLVGMNYVGKILTAVSYLLKNGSCDSMSPALKAMIKMGELTS